MADDAPVPISTSVPETVTIDTGADAKTLGDLNKEFADFWSEQDSGAPDTTAPAAPDTGAGQETKETKVEPPPKPKPEPPKEKAPSPPPKADKQFSDDEVDKMALPTRAGQPPEMQADFKQLKDFWKADRARLEQIEQQNTQLQAELQQAKANSFTPEQKADYENATAVRRKFEFVSDPEFLQRYQAPVQERFQAVLQEAVGVLPERQSAQAWAEHIIQNYSPDQLSKQWWLQSVISKVPDELNRQALLNSVTDLLKAQRDRDMEVTRRTNDKSAYENWMVEKTNVQAERIKADIMAEIGEQEKQIQEVLPRDAEAAKTPEERAAIDAHNERFQRLNGHFVETMQDISKNGPKAWVRAAVQATRAMWIEEQYKTVHEELEAVKDERDQLRRELDKIAGVRRKISNTTGTPPTSGTKKDGQGLSIKNLDERKSFQNFWEEQDRQ